MFTIFEIIDMVIMTLALGYIFKDAFGIAPKDDNYDPVAAYMRPRQMQWQQIWFAAAIVAPGIIIHELGHKFAAMAFGAVQPTFYAACSSTALFTGNFLNFSCTLLLLAIGLKAAGFGFLFFVPGYVSYDPAGITAFGSMIIAFAGPFVNLLFWAIPKLLIKYKKIKRKHVPIALLMSRINGFLFILNMLPIPLVDGWYVYTGLLSMLF